MQDSEKMWKQLILRYADGRSPCNCGEAYCLPDGGCRYGCSANQIYTKLEIAARMAKELEASLLALRTISEMPTPAQDSMLSANMRRVATEALPK